MNDLDSLIAFLDVERLTSVAVPDEASKAFLVSKGVSEEQIMILEGADIPKYGSD